MSRPDLDVTYEPDTLAKVATKTPAVPVRFYASSIRGRVSVVMPSDNGLPIGTRLNRAQVEHLIAALSDWAVEEQAREATS